MKASQNKEEALLGSAAPLMPTTEQVSLHREALSINEAAVSIGVGRDQIYKAVARKELRVVKCGRRTLVPVESLRSYLNNLPDLQLGEEV